MPAQFQHLIIYAVVILCLLYLASQFRRRVKRKGQCGEGCGCGKEIRRNPAIQKYICDREKEAGNPGAVASPDNTEKR